MKRLILFIFWSALVGESKAAQIVVPPSLENVAGNDSGSFQASGIRVQQIYSSSLFSSLSQEPISISALKFRVEPNGIAFSATPEMEIRFSTSGSDPNLPSSLFQSNIGPDATVTLPRSVISLQGNPGLSFDVVIPLPNRFVYDRSKGNLLVDFFIYTRGGIGSLDMQNQDGDGITLVSGGIGQQQGGLDPAGFVTAFVYEPVPEPHTLALVLLGITLLTRRKNVPA